MSIEKKLLVNCPTHASPVVRTDLPDGDVRVFCRYGGCKLDWTFATLDCSRPSCMAGKCAEDCWVHLKVGDIYTNGTAWASCPHGCRSISLRRHEPDDLSRAASAN